MYWSEGVQQYWIYLQRPQYLELFSIMKKHDEHKCMKKFTPLERELEQQIANLVVGSMNSSLSVRSR